MILGYCRVSTRGQLDGNSLEQQTNEELQNGNLLVVTKLDRFARTVVEGIETIRKLMGKGVRIHILNMGLIENTAMGNLIVTNLLAFGEFERAMIIERTQSGKAIAKTKEGFKEGRPRKYSKEQLDLAIKLKENNSYGQVEKMTGIPKSTLIREIRRRGIQLL